MTAVHTTSMYHIPSLNFSKWKIKVYLISIVFQIERPLGHATCKRMLELNTKHKNKFSKSSKLAANALISRQDMPAMVPMFRML